VIDILILTHNEWAKPSLQALRQKPRPNLDLEYRNVIYDRYEPPFTTESHRSADPSSSGCDPTLAAEPGLIHSNQSRTILHNLPVFAHRLDHNQGKERPASVHR